MLRKLMQLCLSALLLGGCAYHQGQSYDINNPVVRKTGWFSYLDGNDIREACAAGGSERYRLVYNGQYDQQLRSYEIYVGQDGGGVLNARALNNDETTFSITLSDPFAPWTWRESQAKLSPAEVAQFRDLLTGSGYGSGAPQGLRLQSRDFYWVATGCQAGVFHFYAWNNRPQSMAPAGFDPIKFQDFLLKHDQTGLSFRPPHVTTPVERNQFSGSGGGSAGAPNPNFTLTVKGEGLGGLLNAF
jgi:hypothetical protein